MALRIALLGPRSTRSTARRQMERLSKGLMASGVEVDVFACPADSDLEAAVLGRLLETARDFDLVHNHLGPRAQVLAPLFPRPMLTTLYKAAPEALAPFFVPGKPGVWLAATEERWAPAGATLLATIPLAEDTPEDRERLARAYVELYERVLRESQARRADREHDGRPWGEYWVLEDTPGWKVKRIDVLPGKRLSYQKHSKRAEHWLVVRGQGRVTLDGREVVIGPGETIDIEPGTAHRVENAGEEPLTFIEVQQGSYFGEDDIERLDDDFGRR